MFGFNLLLLPEQDVHTAGRLCDKEVEGCEAAHFQPINVNGWFWASTLKMMPPTNFVSNNAVVGLRQQIKF